MADIILTEDEERNIQVQARLEAARMEARQTSDKRAARAEMLRMAREILVQNRLDLPAGTREITLDDITELSEGLLAYINQ